MWSALRVVVCGFLGLAIASCSPNEFRYYRNGIGTDLPASDIAQANRLQEIYFGYLCRDANVPHLVGPTYFECSYDGMGSTEWQLFVQTGMNDIDRRCMSYLGWLYGKRRSRAPIIQQLSDTRTLVEAAMNFAGETADAITFVGSVFGFASSSFTNLRARLLLEIDHSTIETLVRSRQVEFRKGVNKLNIDNKPAAIYALRSYLSICVPYTIETQINTTITVFEQGGEGALRANPLIDPDAINASLLGSSITPIPDNPSRPPEHRANRLTPVEEQLSNDTIMRIQIALCVTGTGDPGPQGSETRNAFRAYFESINSNVAPDRILGKREADLLNRAVRDVLACQTAGFKSAYEVGAFGVLLQGETQVAPTARLTEFQGQLSEWLKKKGDMTAVPQDGRLGPETRAAIAKARQLMFGAGGNDSVDFKFHLQLLTDLSG